MRKRIRLTGRRQIPRAAVEAKAVEVGERKLITLSITNPDTFSKFPRDARLKLRLFENKVSETLEFGTLGDPRATADLRNGAFAAPSCQLRVVAPQGDQTGLLLGSTSTWTLRADGSPEGGVGGEGILMFQPFDIAPRTWKLNIREDDYPVVYLDRSIPDSATWVRNDPVFISCVLPSIIKEIFDDVLSAGAGPEVVWMKDWVRWADTLMPGNAPPYADGPVQKQAWIDNLLDTFAKRHRALEMLSGHLKAEGGE
ncbi:hypothetical protein [Rhodovulum sulfidophilum]|uniref:hypothetical protein n=1 Tax=Rhodovulum sulfidophilum TaxID=35806 RepID=UPI0019222F22|nr:hypothetical protein [Rhodovulum sulfidophilum]MBL3560242.1 hypothetical protein [Rhodovulum sulfidophilum]